MDPINSARWYFEEAQRAVQVRDFPTAVRYAREAEDRVLAVSHVMNSSSAKGPIYSIIVVTCENRSDTLEVIEQFSMHASSNDFEVLIINNGPAVGYEPNGCLNSLNTVNVGFNYGCSGGRNVGARVARGEFLIFLDDDGIVGQNTVQNLIDTIIKYRAVVVRGRVRPKSPAGLSSPIYDLGEEIAFSVPNAEGISIWRKKEFLENGGFDSLLSGHEGLALWSKMYRFYGPEGSLYTPHAVMLHDYAGDVEQLNLKKIRRQSNLVYLDFAYPGAVDLASLIQQSRRQSRIPILFNRARHTLDEYPRIVSLAESRLSVLTTSRNGNQFLVDYSKGLKAQTHQNFELIFVCNPADHATMEGISGLWRNDYRFRLLTCNGGPAEALNLSVAHASNEICVIAEDCDISNPARLELILRHFLKNPADACVSFAEFNEQRLYSMFGVHWPNIGVKTRCLMGMPVALGSFAFRKSRFAILFDPTFRAYERKWIHDNCINRRLDGSLIPVNMVYDRCLQDQNQETQFDCVVSAHEGLLGCLSETDKRCCRIFAGLEPCSTEHDISDIENYVFKLIESNLERAIYDQNEVEQVVFNRLLALQHDTQKIRRQRAEKKYRRAIMEAQEVTLQLRSAQSILERTAAEAEAQRVLLNRAEAQLRTKKRSVENLRRKLADIYGSRSWQVTRPLRVAAKSLRTYKKMVRRLLHI